ncbi:MAG: phosphoribosyl-AMP cyclohydrolase [Planctomycetota bacterium]|nr:phosphoribosyl-AMP cyclohydrolase [Planctomycetota bacterium]
MSDDFLTRLKFDDKGLIAVIIQDADDGQVLMFAYANREAVEKTIQTGKMHFYSRSRRKLWLKGETSGNFQHVVEIRHDCDADALLVKVRQKGGACHLGFRSCFSFLLRDGKVVEDGEKMFDPGEVYGKGGS